MIRSDVLAAILAMAVVTYACRAGGYAILRAVRAPRFVERMLQHLPGPLFCAYVAPSLAQWGAFGWIAAVAVMVTQYATGNLAAAILAGALAMAGLQMVG